MDSNLIKQSLIGAVRRLLGVGLAGFAFGLAATPAGTASPIRAVATTGMVADLVRQVGGEEVSVTALMGPGVDPHLYKAKPSDVSQLQRAEVIFYNGLLLEGKMGELFDRMARGKRLVLALTADLPKERLLFPDGAEHHPDPHVWFDVSLWAECVPVVVRGLSQARPEKQELFSQRGAEVKRRLAELHAWSQRRAAELSPEKRVLVTSHDAYGYFGKAYGFKVIGLQGISTATEAGLADMARLADFIRAHGVKAVFVESSVPHATIERISRDSGAKVGGELFSDAMGTPGERHEAAGESYDVGTYEGMIKHNLNTVVEALK